MSNTVLVPVDLSDVTSKTIETAIKYSKALHCEIMLLHIQEPVYSYATLYNPEIPTMVVEPYGEIESDSVHSDEARLDELKSRYENEEITINTVVRVGAVQEEILECINNIKPELIVTGTHGHGPLYHLFMGSVNEKLLKECEVPIMIVK